MAPDRRARRPTLTLDGVAWIASESATLTARLRGRRPKKAAAAAPPARPAVRKRRPRLQPAASSPQLQRLAPHLARATESSPQLLRAAPQRAGLRPQRPVRGVRAAPRRRRPQRQPLSDIGPAGSNNNNNNNNNNNCRTPPRRGARKCPGSPRTTQRAAAAEKAERRQGLLDELGRAEEDEERSPRFLDEGDLRAVVALRGDTHVGERYREWLRAKAARTKQGLLRGPPRSPRSPRVQLPQMLR